MKKKDRVEKEERAMYKRMVEGESKKRTDTHNKAPRQDRWVGLQLSVYICIYYIHIIIYMCI